MKKNGGVTTDEASDKSILYSGKIIKTEEITVDFHDQNNTSYEMQYMPGRTRN
jgi:hypothetical protein